MVKITNIIDFKKKFANKIGDYRRRDKGLFEKYPELNENSKTLLLSEGIRMIDELETDICVECNCNILFQEYNMWCFYQFSFDRIDNKKYTHSIIYELYVGGVILIRMSQNDVSIVFIDVV